MESASTCCLLLAVIPLTMLCVHTAAAHLSARSNAFVRYMPSPVKSCSPSNDPMKVILSVKVSAWKSRLNVITSFIQARACLYSARMLLPMSHSRSVAPSSVMLLL